MNDIDPKWTAWTTNVADRFKGQGVEEIKAELKATAFPFAAYGAKYDKSK